MPKDEEKKAPAPSPNLLPPPRVLKQRPRPNMREAEKKPKKSPYNEM
jgi:hypothetical protein